ncbi:unnamed protein product [Lactuca saligna]|uniref:TIR domain-containing protein n=1 Tax=Lactuca saligna TaxID=75948 RepID=A0AA35ZYR9_LACSI|nr:unnamed protein product [Lactuca saligna]
MVVLSEYSEGSSSSSTNDKKYDIFLSFRGADTRHSFIDHLHKALLGANISTFLDDEEIETGGDLKPELESAIKESRASIIVLSKNYANSSWCLDELVLILRERMISNHIVIPIFYHVEPTHVRKQQSSFADAIAKHRRVMKAETNANRRNQWAQKIDRWIQALTIVADLKGMSIDGRGETEFIEEIAKDVYHRLRISSRIPLPLLIGRDDSKKFVTSWLKDTSSHTADILTILGMGGIGKTSLAKYVYGLHCDEFATSSFIEDISRRCEEKYNGLLDLQKQLYDEISKRSSIQVHDVSVYTLKIENALAHKKVLIVLDDVDSLDQLDALLGSKGLHPESKIIITTKDAWLTESCVLFKANIKPTHEKHLLQGLLQGQSKQLLCFNTCVPNNPKAGYEDVLEKLVEYCEGHPLALKVLGKSLHNRDVFYWEEFLKGLKKENNSPINNVLRKSFDSLPSENDKELFKHIACFFVGTDRDFTETILKACDIKTKYGIMNLIDKCFVDITSNNELMMHGLLREMGRVLVHQESPNKPWKRSRLWCHEDSFKVLKQKKGKENILGLTLDTRMIKKEKLHGSFELKTEALSKMNNLMLLQLNYVQITTLNHLSFGIVIHNNSRVEKRSYLACLQKTKELPALERLIATNCNELVEICESIKECVELVYIDLSYCKKLEKLNIGMLRKLKTLLLEGCNLGSSHIEIRDMDSPEMIKANIIDINKKLSSSTIHEDIPSDSQFFTISLPISLVKLSLVNNNLSTESFPMEFSWLVMLKELRLDNNPITSLPICVRRLPRLQLLSLSQCERLTSVEHPPSTLTFLNVHYDKQSLLRKVVFDPKMCPLDLITPWTVVEPLPCEIEGIVKIQPMASVEEKVLHSLGWNKLDFLNKKGVRHYSYGRESTEHQIQMFYEFGIFSTIYLGKDMPKWIRCRSEGESISFNIPSSPNRLRGFNFCYVYTHRFLPMIIIHNKTKNRAWFYEHCSSDVHVGEEGCYTVLSHWMFGINEMEGGDEVSITVRRTSYFGSPAWECGVEVVYDAGNTAEEDVLTYYKSWNHIIGGDLTGYQLATGEYYILSIRRIMLRGIDANDVYPNIFRDNTHYKEFGIRFTAFSQRQPVILGHVPEENETSTCNDPTLNDEDEVDEVEVEMEFELEFEFVAEADAEVEREQEAKRSCMWSKWFKCTRA